MKFTPTAKSFRFTDSLFKNIQREEVQRPLLFAQPSLLAFQTSDPHHQQLAPPYPDMYLGMLHPHHTAQISMLRCEQDGPDLLWRIPWA